MARSIGYGVYGDASSAQTTAQAYYSSSSNAGIAVSASDCISYLNNNTSESSSDIAAACGSGSTVPLNAAAYQAGQTSGGGYNTSPLTASSSLTSDISYLTAALTPLATTGVLVAKAAGAFGPTTINPLVVKPTTALMPTAPNSTNTVLLIVGGFLALGGLAVILTMNNRRAAPATMRKAKFLS